MLNFRDYLTEAAGKNLHLEHIEDEILNNGIEGARASIRFIQSLRDMLAGNSKSQVNMTVKWDGAPAIFAGIDPSDGKFFVGKKGVFNKTPLLYKKQSDIDLGGYLGEVFSTALKELPSLGIKKVLQGDLLFLKSTLGSEIDGHHTFQPNTILYAVPKDSDVGRKVSRAKIGIVWHTTYTGRAIKDMKASFGKKIASKFRSSRTIWMDDATYRDVSGKALFSPKETEEFNDLLSQAGRLFRTVDGDAFRMLTDDDELRQKTMTFVNTYVRGGSNFPSADKMTKGLVDYLNQWFKKEIDKKKTEKSKADWSKRRDAIVQKVIMNKSQLTAMFELMKVLVQAKGMVIDQFNKTQEMDTLLRTAKGFQVTKQEGFVAIDKMKGGAVKLVDRLEFSKANFSPEIIKGWQK